MLSERSVTALRQLQAHLREQLGTESAARFNMGFWGTSYEKAMQYFADDPTMKPLGKPACGVQCCLAGETCLALGAATVKDGKLVLNSKLDSVEGTAANLLNLDYYQKKQLFYGGWRNSADRQNSRWPEPFQSRYENAVTADERLLAGIDRIEHFITTGGDE